MERIDNVKKANILLNNIYDDIMDNENLTYNNFYELKRYFTTFKSEPDYNVAQYGNLLIYYWQVRELFTESGYKYASDKLKNGEFKISDDVLWLRYKQLVGRVVDYILSK